MASSFPEVTSSATILVTATGSQDATHCRIYSEHCHRIYSLAFWMTNSELAAEQLASKTFARAFASGRRPRTEQIDQAFLAEVRELTPVGALTLNGAVPPGIIGLCGNLKRIHIVRAVAQLPATERLVFLLHDVEGYDHSRIARLLDITESESRFGLHQARLRIRELVLRESPGL